VIGTPSVDAELHIQNETDLMLISAFDIATVTGGADGDPNGKPRAWHWNLKEAGDSRPLKLAMLRDYTDRYLAEHKPDAVFYERGLGLAAAMEIGMSDDTMALLRGAIGVVESCAAAARIKRIEAIGVQDARRHLLGAGRIPKGEGKKLVMERCRMLGWAPQNNDQADALCLWSLACAKMSPAMAAFTTPLFAR
jgi:hypothetical protein